MFRHALLAALCLSACATEAPGNDCRLDPELCSGDCTSTGECIAAGTAIDIRVFWTVDGREPTPGGDVCGDIRDLDVSLLSRRGQDITLSPVACDLGRITFIDMPPHFNRVRLEAFDERGRFLGEISAPLDNGDTFVELPSQRR